MVVDIKKLEILISTTWCLDKICIKLGGKGLHAIFDKMVSFRFPG